MGLESFSSGSSGTGRTLRKLVLTAALTLNGCDLPDSKDSENTEPPAAAATDTGSALPEKSSPEPESSPEPAPPPIPVQPKPTGNVFDPTTNEDTQEFCNRYNLSHPGYRENGAERTRKTVTGFLIQCRDGSEFFTDCDGNTLQTTEVHGAINADGSAGFYNRKVQICQGVGHDEEAPEILNAVICFNAARKDMEEIGIAPGTKWNERTISGVYSVLFYRTNRAVAHDGHPTVRQEIARLGIEAAKVPALQAEITQLQGFIVQYEARIRQLESQMQQLQGEAARLRSELEVKNRRITELEAELEKCRNPHELERKQEEARILRHGADTTRRALRQKETELATPEAEKTKWEIEKLKAQQRIRYLETGTTYLETGRVAVPPPDAGSGSDGFGEEYNLPEPSGATRPGRDTADPEIFKMDF